MAPNYGEGSSVEKDASCTAEVHRVLCTYAGHISILLSHDPDCYDYGAKRQTISEEAVACG